jgi:hypothetical protein
MKDNGRKQPEREPEWEGSVWKHPYMIYILLTVVLFAFLLGMGWLALTQGWIPDRGINVAQ